MKHVLIASLNVMISLCAILNLNAQIQEEEKYELAFLAGTIQPFLLQGGNFEVDLYTPNMVFNYSHGFSLDLESSTNTTVGDALDQGLALHLPYTTGFGIGYRLNKFFDVRFETKLHKFEVYYDGTDRELAVNQVTNYTTLTLGLGTYFRWKPFEKQDNILNGIFTSTSIRYWPNVYTSLDGGEIVYDNRVTENFETHETANIGIANTPFLFNFSVGYSVKF